VDTFSILQCCDALSHTRTVVRDCFKGDEASQWKKPKFDPSSHQNLLTDLHKNWHAWLLYGPHSTCTILYRSVQGFLFPRYVILPCFWGDFLWVLQSGYSLYTPKRIFTQNTSKNVVPGKHVPFWGPDDYNLYLDPWISEKPPFLGPILTKQFFATENSFNMGMLQYKLPLIVIVAP